MRTGRYSPSAVVRNWISRELLSDSGFRFQFLHALTIQVGPLSARAYLNRRIAPEIGRFVTPWGTTVELIARLCSNRQGIWFYAGWIDQAVLHVGRVERGEADSILPMLSQFDDDQVDQAGDMLVGFLSLEKDWLLTIEASPEESRFTVSLRANSEDHLNAVESMLLLPE